MKKEVLFGLALIAAVGSRAQSLQPGDLMPVAYRTSALSTDDEVLWVSRRNLDSGTVITFTDSKYTSNAQPQCTGGLVWTVPADLPSGSLISLKSDLGTVNGVVCPGNTFGLSSSGDQVLVYQGSAASPSYIFALSTKGWASAPMTTCTGGNCILPTGTQSGISALSMDGAPGNASGVSANAYYNGPIAGAWSAIQTALLNPANWTVAASGTAAQSWPSYVFPGPPSVVGAAVVGPNAVRVVFSKNMTSSSVIQTSNYTGIANLSAVVMSNNGTQSDTALLTFSTPFINNASYALTVQNVIDDQGVALFVPYTFSFTYQTRGTFGGRYVVVQEGGPSGQNITLTITNPSISQASLQIVGSSHSTGSASDLVVFPSSQAVGVQTQSLTFTVQALDDAFSENDEYVVLKLTGIAAQGPDFFTVYIQDNDRVVPVAQKAVELLHLGSFDPDSSGSSTCEVVAYDPLSKRIFTSSSIQNRLDIVDFSDPTQLSVIASVDLSPYGGITSVACHNGRVAVASPNADEALPGSVVFLDTNGVYLGQVTVGALPDMVTFSPNGDWLLVANEGQPRSDYSLDPEGSVSVIDMSTGIPTQAQVTTASFAAFNAQYAALKAAGVRLTGPGSTVSQDVEPEYIVVAPDQSKAWITLQENNAIAVLDLSTKSITDVWPLGTKSMMAPINGMDASDQNTHVLLANWPTKQFYIPDAISHLSANGNSFLITANEGDEREYAALNERKAVSAMNLDPTSFPNAAMLKESHALGRFRVSNQHGDTDGDGDFDQLYAVGARSFSIWDGSTGSLVFDSGKEIESIISTDSTHKTLFNADNEDVVIKSRSRAKGPEPEGVAVATFGSSTYAFIALERVGGLMVYDVTNPYAPVFTDYKNTRSSTGLTGDLGPETVRIISSSESPDHQVYAVVANEISGTLSIFQVLRANLGMEEGREVSEGLAVYPNPTRGELFFPMQKQVQVFNMEGLPVLECGECDRLNVSALPQGVYIFRRADGSTARFVRQ